jgi:hypothetical protein
LAATQNRRADAERQARESRRPQPPAMQHWRGDVALDQAIQQFEQQIDTGENLAVGFARQAEAIAARRLQSAQRALEVAQAEADAKADGYRTAQAVVATVKAEGERHKELADELKKREGIRRQAEALRKEIIKTREDAAKDLEIRITVANLESEIAKLDRLRDRALFLNVVDPREERRAWAERRDNAKRITEETTADERRAAQLLDRQRSRRHMTRRSREWLEEFQAANEAQAMGQQLEADMARKREEIETVQRDVQAKQLSALESIREKLTTLLQASEQ